MLGSFPCSDIRGGAVECKIILYSNTDHEVGYVHIIFQPPAKSCYADVRSYSLSSNAITSSSSSSNRKSDVTSTIELKEETSAKSLPENKILSASLPVVDDILLSTIKSPEGGCDEIPTADNLSQPFLSIINERPYKKILDSNRNKTFSQSVASVI